MDDKVVATVRAGLRLNLVLWTAFAFVPIVFGIILVLQPGPAGDPQPMVPPMLVVVALMQLPVLIFMRLKTMGSVALFEPDDLRTTDIAKGSDLDSAVMHAQARYRTGTIVSLAFAESIVIFGFVSSFLTGQLLWFVGHWLVQFMLLLLIRPRAGGLLATLEPAERQGLRQGMGW
jgi:hypothetical protein